MMDYSVSPPSTLSPGVVAVLRPVLVYLTGPISSGGQMSDTELGEEGGHRQFNHNNTAHCAAESWCVISG